jgi:hypothetical protein
VKELKKMFLRQEMMNSHVLATKKWAMMKKWCFSNRKMGKKMLQKSDVLTMKNIAEKMVFQQWEKWGKCC